MNKFILLLKLSLTAYNSISHSSSLCIYIIIITSLLQSEHEAPPADQKFCDISTGYQWQSIGHQRPSTGYQRPNSFSYLSWGRAPTLPQKLFSKPPLPVTLVFHSTTSSSYVELPMLQTK